jgi:hypothetical protein
MTMAEHRFVSEILAQVFKDMAVFDATEARIGTVVFVYLGSSSDEARASRTGAAEVAGCDRERPFTSRTSGRAISRP